MLGDDALPDANAKFIVGGTSGLVVSGGASNMRVGLGAVCTCRHAYIRA